jgi:hypothetical protein
MEKQAPYSDLDFCLEDVILDFLRQRQLPESVNFYGSLQVGLDSKRVSAPYVAAICEVMEPVERDLNSWETLAGNRLAQVTIRVCTTFDGKVTNDKQVATARNFHSTLRGSVEDSFRRNDFSAVMAECCRTAGLGLMADEGGGHVVWNFVGSRRKVSGYNIETELTYSVPVFAFGS